MSVESSTLGVGRPAAKSLRGLAIPEVEWVMMNRGLDAQVSEQVDGDGVVKAPVTYETAPRGYFDYWRSLMEAGVRSAADARQGAPAYA